MSWKFWKSCEHDYKLTQFTYYLDNRYSRERNPSYKYSAFCTQCGKTISDSVFGGGHQIRAEHIVQILNKGHKPK